jgi:hypothetical protein
MQCKTYFFDLCISNRLPLAFNAFDEIGLVVSAFKGKSPPSSGRR